MEDASFRCTVREVAEVCRTSPGKVILAFLKMGEHGSALEGQGKDAHITSVEACRKVVAQLAGDEAVNHTLRALKEESDTERRRETDTSVLEQSSTDRGGGNERNEQRGGNNDAGSQADGQKSCTATQLCVVGRGRSQSEAISQLGNRGYAFLRSDELEEDCHVWISNLSPVAKSFLEVENRRADHLPPAVPQVCFTPQKTDRGTTTERVEDVETIWSRALVRVLSNQQIRVPGTGQKSYAWQDGDLDPGFYVAKVWPAIPTDVGASGDWAKGIVVRPLERFRWDGTPIDNADVVEDAPDFVEPLVRSTASSITSFIEDQEQDEFDAEGLEKLFGYLGSHSHALRRKIHGRVVENVAEAGKNITLDAVRGLLRIGSVSDRTGAELLRSSITTCLDEVDARGLDLETDGREIWQLGTALSSEKTETYGRSRIKEALDEVRVAEPDIWVGHNFHDWDLQALRRQDVEVDENKVWDTLRYEALLSPRRPSLSLDTSHQAGDDAGVAYRLYRTQVLRILLRIYRGVPVPEDALLGPLRHRADTVEKVQGLLSDTERYHEALWELCEDRRDEVLADVALPAVVQRIQSAVDEYPDADAVLLLYPRPLETAVERLRGVHFKGVEESPHRKLVRSPGKEGLDSNGFTARLASLYRQESRRHSLVPTLGALSPWIQSHFQARPEWLGPVASDGGEAKGRDANHWAVPIDAYRKVDLPEPDHVVVLASDLIEACSHSVVATFASDELRDFISRNHLWAQFDGAGSYCQLKKNHLRELEDVQALIPQQASAWLQRTPTGDYAIHAYEPQVLRSIREKLSGNCSWNEVGIDEDPIATVACVKVNEDLGQTAPSQQRINPETRQRARYWTVQALLLRRINQADGTRPTVLLTSGEEKASEIASFFKRLGWYVPEGGTLRRRLELVQASRSSRRLLVVTLDNWAALMVRDVDVNIQLVVESLPMKQQQALRRGDVHPETLDDLPTEGDAAHSPPKDTEENLGQDEEALQENGQARPFALQRGLHLVSPYLRWLAHTAALMSKQGQLWVVDPRVEPIRLPGGLDLKAHRVPAYDEETYDSYFATAEQYFSSPVQQELVVPDDWKKTMAHVFLPEQEDGTPGEFYDFQEPYLEPIVHRDSDVLVELPTGSGKSVLFQAPALYHGLRHGLLTIVVTPLKALMVDQGNSLHKKGFLSSVEYVNGDLPYIEIRDIYRRVASGEIALLYVAPERFRSRAFVRAIRSRIQADGTLCYFVFDEAHTVSLWGLDFRPDFLRAVDFVNEWRAESGIAPFPCLMLSATITEQIYEHLESALVDYQAESAGG
jgi:hypothetical protein